MSGGFGDAPSSAITPRSRIAGKSAVAQQIPTPLGQKGQFLQAPAHGLGCYAKLMGQQNQLSHVEAVVQTDNLIEARAHSRRGHQKRRSKALGESLFDREGEFVALQNVRMGSVGREMAGFVNRGLNPTLPIMVGVDQHAGPDRRVEGVKAEISDGSGRKNIRNPSLGSSMVIRSGIGPKPAPSRARRLLAASSAC